MTFNEKYMKEQELKSKTALFGIVAKLQTEFYVKNNIPLNAKTIVYYRPIRSGFKTFSKRFNSFANSLSKLSDDIQSLQKELGVNPCQM